MKIGTLTIVAATAAVLPSLTSSFSVVQQQHSQLRSLSSSSSSSCLSMAKGFDNSSSNKEDATTEKSAAQIQREKKGKQYDDIAAAGGQEYLIFVRQFGSADDSWLPCGSIAVERGDQVSNAIFANEEPLKKAITRSMPKLAGMEAEFEYGYNMKIFPDEPVEVAVKRTGSNGPSIGNWFSNLLSPVDASNVGKN